MLSAVHGFNTGMFVFLCIYKLLTYVYKLLSIL
jgi:hypothetical protein